MLYPSYLSLLYVYAPVGSVLTLFKASLLNFQSVVYVALLIASVALINCVAHAAFVLVILGGILIPHFFISYLFFLRAFHRKKSGYAEKTLQDNHNYDKFDY